MIKLVKNELYKIFHKKMLYVLLAVVVGIFVFSMIVNKVFSNTYAIDDMFVPMYEQQIATLDLTKTEDAEIYVQLQSAVDVSKEAKELNLDYNSPEGYYFYNDYEALIEKYYTTKYIEKNEEAAEQVRLAKEEAKAKLSNFDWKQYIQNKIDDYKIVLQGEMEDNERDVINETVKVLQYRIDNNIPFTNGAGSEELDQYIGSYAQYSTMNKDDKAYVNRNELLAKKQVEKSVEEGKYKLEHKLFKDTKEYNTAQGLFLEQFMSLSMFVSICIFMIAGSIVAEEFNKGTIKQLLIRPFTRSKILVSKMIATFISVVAFVVVLSTVLCVLGGLFTGTFGTLVEPIVHYNLNTGSIVVTNTITEALIHFAAILPEIIILIMFTILASTITGNTALSVILGFVVIFAPQLFSGLIDRVRVLSFLPMYNWDLTQFLFGGLATSKFLTLTKAIIVDIVTVVGLYIANILVFKKKDVKNQ